MQAPLSARAEGDPRETWRPDIAGLRGLAVLLVVAYHLQLRGAGGGFIGVDIFFVISGYLMTRIVWGGLEQGRFGYWRFMAARAARIWPALGAMVLVLLCVSALVLPPFDVQILAQQSVYSVLFWANQFFHDRAGYNTQTADTNWLLHTWSLSVEWQFYLLYPLVLMGLAKMRATRRAAVVGVALLSIVSLVVHAVLTGTRPTSAFFLLPARAWELLAGGLVFFLGGHAALTPRWRRGVAYLGLALVLGGALWLALRRVPAVGAGWPLLVPVSGAALLLWAHDARHPVLSHRSLQSLGRWSYSIYLWHWPLIVAARMTDVFLDHALWGALGVSVMSIVCGALSYRFVESFEASGRQRLRRPALAMAMAAVAAGWALATHGWAGRAGDGASSHADYLASVRALYYPERCSNFMKTVADTQVCSVPQGNEARILVIGDSHAEQLYPWFVAHSAVSADFYTQAECPPVPNFERTQNGFHCRDYAGAAWQKAAAGPYDTLVLAAYWPNIGLDGAPYCHAEADGACPQVNGERKQVLVRDELESAIRRVVAQGRTVVMLAPTPEARVRVPERVERERFWFGAVRLQIDERVVAARAGWLTPMFERLKDLRGFHLVSLNDRLCRSGVCKVYDAALERPVFIDENHLDPLWVSKQDDLFGCCLARRTGR